MGKMSIHGEPKFSEGQPRVFTNLVRVKTLHELHHGPEKVKILVEAISVIDAKGYIAYNKAKGKITKSDTLKNGPMDRAKRSEQVQGQKKEKQTGTIWLA